MQITKNELCIINDRYDYNTFIHIQQLHTGQFQSVGKTVNII